MNREASDPRPRTDAAAPFTLRPLTAVSANFQSCPVDPGDFGYPGDSGDDGDCVDCTNRLEEMGCYNPSDVYSYNDCYDNPSLCSSDSDSGSDGGDGGGGGGGGGGSDCSSDDSYSDDYYGPGDDHACVE